MDACFDLSDEVLDLVNDWSGPHFRVRYVLPG